MSTLQLKAEGEGGGGQPPKGSARVDADHAAAAAALLGVRNVPGDVSNGSSEATASITESSAPGATNDAASAVGYKRTGAPIDTEHDEPGYPETGDFDQGYEAGGGEGRAYGMDGKVYGMESKRSRMSFSWRQVAVLEQVFETDPLPASSLRMQLAERLGVPPRSVQVWFQNRRQKWKQSQQALGNHPVAFKNYSPRLHSLEQLDAQRALAGAPRPIVPPPQQPSTWQQAAIAMGNVYVPDPAGACSSGASSGGVGPGSSVAGSWPPAPPMAPQPFPLPGGPPPQCYGPPPSMPPSAPVPVLPPPSSAGMTSAGIAGITKPAMPVRPGATAPPPSGTPFVHTPVGQLLAQQHPDGSGPAPGGPPMPPLDSQVERQRQEMQRMQQQQQAQMQQMQQMQMQQMQQMQQMHLQQQQAQQAQMQAQGGPLPPGQQQQPPQHGMAPPVMAPPGMVPPGMAPPGMVQPGMAPPPGMPMAMATYMQQPPPGAPPFMMGPGGFMPMPSSMPPGQLNAASNCVGGMPPPPFEVIPPSGNSFPQSPANGGTPPAQFHGPGQFTNSFIPGTFQGGGYLGSGNATPRAPSPVQDASPAGSADGADSAGAEPMAQSGERALR